VSAGKFVGEGITAAVLKLNPFGQPGYERRARNKAYRKARRKHKRGKELTADEIEILKQTEEVDMDVQAFVVQAVMAAVRHGLTAGGLVGVVGSEESMAQIAGVVALVVGGAWSLWRKWTAAKAKTE
jgi:hypothetical protein